MFMAESHVKTWRFSNISGTFAVPEMEKLRVLMRLSAWDISKTCLFVSAKCMLLDSALIVTLLL